MMVHPSVSHWHISPREAIFGNFLIGGIMNDLELLLLSILVDMHRDTGKSEEELVKEFLRCSLENIGVDYETLETPHGSLTIIKSPIGVT